MSRPKFHLPQDVIDDILHEFKCRGLYIEAEHLDWDLPDPKDKVFYEVVMEERKAEDAYLVTGNIRHFPLKPFVVTPRQMLDIVLGESE